MRIALGVEYDGSGFRGWESQRNAKTVQATLEAAVSRVANEPVRTVCAGRTDARVHGLGQVVHFDTAASRNEHAWVFGTNGNLPPQVSVLWARTVPDSFHARFSAMGRSYRYVILNRASRPAVLNAKVSWECRPLDIIPMQQALRAYAPVDAARFASAAASLKVADYGPFSATEADVLAHSEL